MRNGRFKLLFQAKGTVLLVCLWHTNQKNRPFGLRRIFRKSGGESRPNHLHPSPTHPQTIRAPVVSGVAAGAFRLAPPHGRNQPKQRAVPCGTARSLLAISLFFLFDLGACGGEFLAVVLNNHFTVFNLLHCRDTANGRIADAGGFFDYVVASQYYFLRPTLQF